MGDKPKVDPTDRYANMDQLFSDMKNKSNATPDQPTKEEPDLTKAPGGIGDLGSHLGTVMLMPGEMADMNAMVGGEVVRNCELSENDPVTNADILMGYRKLDSYEAPTSQLLSLVLSETYGPGTTIEGGKIFICYKIVPNMFIGWQNEGKYPASIQKGHTIELSGQGTNIRFLTNTGKVEHLQDYLIKDDKPAVSTPTGDSHFPHIILYQGTDIQLKTLKNLVNLHFHEKQLKQKDDLLSGTESTSESTLRQVSGVKHGSYFLMGVTGK